MKSDFFNRPERTVTPGTAKDLANEGTEGDILATCKTVKHLKKRLWMLLHCSFKGFSRRSQRGAFSGVKDLASRRDRRLGTGKIYGDEMSGPPRSREKRENLNTHADLSFFLRSAFACVESASLSASKGRVGRPPHRQEASANEAA